jgi:hypothetical protein
MNPKFIPSFLVLACGYVVLACGQSPPTNAPVIAEVEIREKGELARISVYLLNQSGVPKALFTGRVGTSADGDFHAVDLDRVAAGRPFGNGILAVPEFVFGPLKVVAPTTVEYGATWHTMRPTLIKLRDQERLLYCEFSVPALYVTNEFVSGKIRFPGLSKETASSLEVPVTKCERKK